VTEATKNPHGERWATIATAIRERRSNLNVDPERPVPREVIDDLIALAVTAPNHYRTNPWRFVVLTGAARDRLGAVAAEAVARQPGAKESIIERQRTQFLRAPAVIVAAAAPDDDPIKHVENKYSVAAGVQNILLGATALGLASAWRSGPAMVDPAVSAPVKAALGLDPGDEIIAFIYLGHPIGPPGLREVPAPRVRFLDQ
jgi:nitroreductase